LSTAAAVTEELFFRGVVQQEAETRLGGRRERHAKVR
jgi:membrane protease YdiL (CAAX protease family)